MDIDLCKQCYDKGIAYARTHDLNEAVQIDGRTLSIRGEDGDNEDMKCAKIWQMGVRVIETASLEQAEEAKRAGFLNNMASQKTNVGSSQITDGTTSSKQDEEIDVVSTEGFASSVFTHVSVASFFSVNLLVIDYFTHHCFSCLLDTAIYFEYFDKSIRATLNVCPPACSRSRSQCYHRRAKVFERERNGGCTHKTLEEPYRELPK